jgi:Fe-S-cluster containining protein
MSEPSPARVNVPFELTLGTRTIEASVAIPDAPMRVADLLPVLLAFADAAVSMAAGGVADAGRSIPCGPHCGACCRQLVPISEAEAQYLAELVDAMPEERRARVRERFREAQAALGEGMLARLRRRAGLKDLEARRRIGLEYFRLGVACPFLENESCSIHEHRPMPCREYLVTSPPPNCIDPQPGSIQPVPMPIKLSTILYCFGDGMGRQKTRWLPLVLALDTELPAAPLFPAPAMFRNFIRQAQALADRQD